MCTLCCCQSNRNSINIILFYLIWDWKKFPSGNWKPQEKKKVKNKENKVKFWWFLFMIFCKRVNYLILVFFIIFIYNFGVCVAFCYEFINYLKKNYYYKFESNRQRCPPGERSVVAMVEGRDTEILKCIRWEIRLAFRLPGPLNFV